MSSISESSQLDGDVNPAIQQVLDAMEAAEISPGTPCRSAWCC